MKSNDILLLIPAVFISLFLNSKSKLNSTCVEMLFLWMLQYPLLPAAVSDAPSGVEPFSVCTTEGIVPLCPVRSRSGGLPGTVLHSRLMFSLLQFYIRHPVSLLYFRLTLGTKVRN